MPNINSFLVIALILGVCFAPLAQAGEPRADFETGYGLYTMCQKKHEHPSDCGDYMTEGVCLGYLAGIFQTSIANKWICTRTKGVTPNGVLVAVYLKWMSDHPKQMADPWLLGASLAFRDAWPCPDKKVDGASRSK